MAGRWQPGVPGRPQADLAVSEEDELEEDELEDDELGEPDELDDPDDAPAPDLEGDVASPEPFESDELPVSPDAVASRELAAGLDDSA